jgi:CBS domain-containing protein
MLVRDVMTGGAEAIGPNDTLETAARSMKERGVGALVVREGEQVLGMITERDIVVRGVAEGLDPARATVASTMTLQLVVCSDDEPIETAARHMEQGGVRLALVLDGTRNAVGTLSVDDVALRAPALAGEILEAARAPERSPYAARGGPWSWWEHVPATPP